MGRELPETNAEYWDAKIERNIARDKENQQKLSETRMAGACHLGI
jgi:G:T-mismatch repair DNA endonuclease (very short patch repair protein)